MIRGSRSGLLRRLFFDQGIPGAAVGTAADPFWLLAAAFLAGKDGLRRFHGDDVTSSVGGWWLVVGGLRRSRTSEQASRNHEDAAKKGENTVHRGSDDPEWEQEKPDNRVKEQRDQGQRPADHQQNAPEQKFEHGLKYVRRLNKLQAPATSYSLQATGYQLRAIYGSPQEQPVLRRDPRGDALRPDAVALLCEAHSANDVDRGGIVDPTRQPAVIAHLAIVTARHHRDSGTCGGSASQHVIRQCSACMARHHDVGTEDVDVVDCA
jgi:hypothetical protein